MNEIEQLRAELAAALAACKQKDELLGHMYASPLVREALAIKPDTSALKAWLGEAIGEIRSYEHTERRFAHFSKGCLPPVGTKLYTPKELK